MNILFLTLSSINSLENRGIYTDLLRKFCNKGHHVSIVTPVERRRGITTNLKQAGSVNILQVKTLNITKTNIFEKGLGTLAIEYQYMLAIRKHLRGEKFDLVLYSTPPITFSKVINHIKQRDGAKTYLLLKDIFPQNALDIGLMREGGLLHRYFRRKEKALYHLSDTIGCMSPANVAYLLNHNPQIEEHKVEVNPNSIELCKHNISFEEKGKIKELFNIPERTTTFIYGGNLGKPQGIDFLINVLHSNLNKTDRFFIIAGTGTERGKIEKWFSINNPSNALLLEHLPKEKYDKLIATCDVGMIFLDPRFTIPNYPSRLLSYLENSLPVIMATDVNTDIGKIAEYNNYGFWCENGDLAKFNFMLNKLCTNPELRVKMGEAGFNYLLNNYLTDISYEKIIALF